MLSNRKLFLACAATIGSGVVLPAAARASEVSVNLISYAGSHASDDLTSTTVSAGAPGAAALGKTFINIFWNMNAQGGTLTFGAGTAGSSTFTVTGDYGGGATTTSLYDDSGNPTNMQFTVSSSYTQNNNSQTHGSTETTQDDLMLANGFGQGSGVSASTFSLSNVPYSSYSVYFYFNSGGSGHDDGISDGTTAYYFNNNDATGTAFPGYSLATNTTSGNYTNGANYVVFNETSPNVNFTWGSASGEFMAGFQIVSTPEPASLSFVGLAATAMLLGRRRRRSFAAC